MKKKASYSGGLRTSPSFDKGLLISSSPSVLRHIPFVDIKLANDEQLEDETHSIGLSLLSKAIAL